MREVTQTVYTFDELHIDAQQKVLEEYADINVSESYWYEDSTDRFVAIAEQFNIQIYPQSVLNKRPKIWFEVGSCNGTDYLNFEGRFYVHYGTRWDSAKLKDELTDREDIVTLYDKLRSKCYEIVDGDKLEILTCDFSSSGRNSQMFEFNAYDELSDEDTEELQEIFNSLRLEFFDMLKKEYEYLTSREAIVETINANEFEFYCTGKRYL